MPGPYNCADYSYPSVGWIMSFEPEDECERVTRVEADQFWTETVEQEWDGILDGRIMSWHDCYRADDAEYGEAGSFYKDSFGNPVIGTYIYAFNEVNVVTFVGRYTFKMSIINTEDVEMSDA